MSSFTVGEQVNVEARTWPGINKPGGAGKVVKIHTEGPGIVVAVDVRYILGGTEKEVELQYVQKHEELNRGGRSRSRREVMNLGPEESNEKPRRSAATKSKKPSSEADSSASAGSAKKKKKPAKKTASSSSKRKSAKKEDAATKKRKADTAKGKSASAAGKKATSTMPPPTSTAAVPQSDSDSVVVSADESEILSANKPPAATTKKAATTSSRQSQPKKKAAVTSSKFDSRSMPPPPPAAAFASSKPASKFSMQPQHPKLKNVDRKNMSAIGGAAAASAKVGQSNLQKVYESNSRAASSFVDAIVGGAEAAAPAAQPAAVTTAAAAFTYPDDVSTVLCVGDEQSTVTGAHTRSTSSGPLSVDAQRRQLFCTNLNDVMMKRMVEEMSIDDILARVNDTIGEQKISSSAAVARPFTNLEIRSYLNELDRQQKIMVTWDTATVYKI